MGQWLSKLCVIRAIWLDIYAPKYFCHCAATLKSLFLVPPVLFPAVQLPRASQQSAQKCKRGGLLETAVIDLRADL